MQNSLYYNTKNISNDTLPLLMFFCIVIHYLENLIRKTRNKNIYKKHK